MTTKQIKDITTSSTTWEDTAYGILQTAAGVTKKFTLAVLRKIVPAADSTTAFQIMKADGTTNVLRVDTTNKRLGIGYATAPAATLYVATDASEPMIAVEKNSDAAAQSGSIGGKRARGTQASRSAVQSDDVITSWEAYGYDGSTFSLQAYIRMFAAENWTPLARGAYARIYVSAIGGVASAIAQQWNANGTITALPTYSATVGGTNRDLYIDNTGLIGYVSSIRESKIDIQDIGNTDWLKALKVKKFYYRKKDDAGNYTEEKDGDIQYGLIYDEVEAVNKDLCFFDIDEDGNEIPRGVNYSKLVPALVARIQELEERLSKAGL